MFPDVPVSPGVLQKTLATHATTCKSVGYRLEVQVTDYSFTAPSLPVPTKFRRPDKNPGSSCVSQQLEYNM
jgi:hypothetical protein